MCREKTSTVENITAPSTTSANTFSRACDTIEPATVGRYSRARPSRRDTMSARDGSPRRAGNVADMSTPMNVPCNASLSRTCTPGNAALRIACHASRAAPSTRTSRRARRAPTRAGRRRASGRCCRRRCARARRRPGRGCRARRPPSATLRAIASAGCGEPRAAADRGSGAAAGARRGGRRRTSARAARRRARERGHRDRVLVGAEDVLRDARPGVALRGVRGARGRGARGARGPARGRAASRPAPSGRRAGRGRRRRRRSRRRSSRRCPRPRRACPRRTPP